MKTAVEWFEQKLDDLNIEIPFGVFEEAKELFEKQIKDAYLQGYLNGKIDPYFSDAENYYNETFLNE